MTDFNLGKLISKYVNYNAMNSNRANVVAQNSFQVPNKPAPSPQAVPDTPNPTPVFAETSGKMAQLSGADNSVFIKDMMKLPKNMNELVYMLQKNVSLAQLNQRFAGILNPSITSSQAQILAQLDGLASSELQAVLQNLNGKNLSSLQSALKNLEINGNIFIDLNEISQMIRANGKDAVARLISAMANASRAGIADLSQMKDAARLINASIATAAQNDNAQTLKLLMLLYLPWLPLQEGTGFDLSIETGASKEEADSILTVSISTINYGIINATLILESSNSVLVNINCDKRFPKDELMIRIQSEEKHYSMQSSLSFEISENIKPIIEPDKPQAKINMSDTNKINPYLLLMAHTLIRHVLEIDKFGIQN